MDEKKLQTYASLAEVVSALAIIVSLLYVGYEVRRTSIVTGREADVILFERGREANRLLIESPGLAELLVAADSAPHEMSEADMRRYLAYEHDFFDSWEMAWSYRVDGVLDDQTWREWDDWFAAEARRRPVFTWTENRHHFTGADFRDHVDRILSGPRGGRG